jgi:hypothetical protein
VNEQSEVDAKNPVFIGGDGRSGTTLLSVILDSHPQICVLPELHFHLPRSLGPDVLDTLAELEMKGSLALTSRAQRVEHVKLALQFVNRCNRAGISYRALGDAINKTMDATGTELVSLSERFHLNDRLGMEVASSAGKRRWGLKIMKQIIHAEDFVDYWSDAQFVHVIRDGRDVAASQVKDHSWGYTSIHDAAIGWASFVSSLRRLKHTLDLEEVRYEDLVTTPRKTLVELCVSLGLTWNSRLLNHAEHEHALLQSRVRHPSADQVRKPIYVSAVGRHHNDLSREEHSVFLSLAGKELSQYGYDTSPEVRCSFNLGHPLCNQLSSCRQYQSGASKRLVGRYIGVDGGHREQIRAAYLDLTRWNNFDSYLSEVRKQYKGAAVRQANKAERLGLAVHQFHRSTFVPDIVEINHSKEIRSGGEMRPAYLKTVEESGGYPTSLQTADNPTCSQHYDMWWGVFEPSPGRTQGSVVVGERLVGYINLRRYGDFALYNLILGHGDWLNSGIMQFLHFELMKEILGRSHTWSLGLNYIVYAGFFQGGEGLQQWKKKALFKPCLLFVDSTELDS